MLDIPLLVGVVACLRSPGCCMAAAQRVPRSPTACFARSACMSVPSGNIVKGSDGKIAFEAPPDGWKPWAPIMGAVGELPGVSAVQA